MTRPTPPRPTWDHATPRLEETVVVALAAARCARAISVDEVSERLRGRISARAERSSLRHWSRSADRLVHCPLCVGWWVSLAISFVVPGRQRLLRGVAAAGVQVLLALAERWVSEEGRTAIHVANRAEQADAPDRETRPANPRDTEDGRRPQSATAP